MSGRPLHLARLSVVLSGIAALLGVAALGDPGLALLLAPGLLLMLPLALGRYLGEERLATLCERRVASAAPLGARRVGALWRTDRLLGPRGGQLLARRLAGRAPPPLTAAPSLPA